MFLALFFAAILPLSPALASECREESLIHFYAGGLEVPSRLVGASDPCDEFGGNLVYTPQHGLYLYVNFNIAGDIDLDGVDLAFGKAPTEGEVHDWLKSVRLAVVDKDWIRRVYHDDREAILNMGNDTLFVSELVVSEGRFLRVLEAFYGSR